MVSKIFYSLSKPSHLDGDCGRGLVNGSEENHQRMIQRLTWSAAQKSVGRVDEQGGVGGRVVVTQAFRVSSHLHICTTVQSFHLKEEKIIV